jgi:hypothetical protein
MVSIKHIPKMYNKKANRLAQSASGYGPICDVSTLELSVDDWRKEIIDYLKDPSQKASRQIKFKAAKFVL